MEMIFPEEKYSEKQADAITELISVITTKNNFIAIMCISAKTYCQQVGISLQCMSAFMTALQATDQLTWRKRKWK